MATLIFAALAFVVTSDIVVILRRRAEQRARRRIVNRIRSYCNYNNNSQERQASR